MADQAVAATGYKFDWKRGVDIPCPITWCKTATICDTVYLADHSDRLKTFSYLPEKDEWSFLSDDHPPTTSFFSMAAVNSHLILAGGESIATKKPSTTITVWDSTSKQWTHPHPAMSTARRNPFAVGWGKYLVVVGGTNEEGGVSTIEILDTDSSTWLPAVKLPVKMVTSLTLIGDDLYLGGDGAKVFTACLSKLVSSHMTSGDTSPWKPLPNTPLQQTTLFTINDRLLSAGGVEESSNKPSSAIHLFEGEKQWSKVGNLPEPNVGCCVSTGGFGSLTGGGVVVVGGRSSTETEFLLQAVNIGRCTV